MIAIRPATVADAAAFTEIYNYYIENSTATFEETAISADAMAERITSVRAQKLPFLALRENSEIIGYAYVHSFHTRRAFRFTVENSIYLKNGCQQRGGGSRLLKELLAQLPAEIHSVIAVLGLPNSDSVALHEKFGFVECGKLREVGFKFNGWRDVGYWQWIKK